MPGRVGGYKERVQDTRGQHRAEWIGWLAVVAAGLLLLMPGVFSIPPVDRDESRFAQASSQMVQSDELGDWIVPRIQDTARLNKPPLIYWLQAGSVSLGQATGLYEKTERWGVLPTNGIGWYRLPSVVSAIIAGLLTYMLALRVLGGHVLGATLAGLCIVACPMVLWDARQARADQMLLACTTLAMLGLHSVWSNRNDPVAGWGGWFALWVGIGLGVMTKGPITPMVVALACIALSATGDGWRWIRRTRPMFGVLLVLAVVGAWVALVMREVGAGAYLRIVFDETIGRSGSAAEGHWGPPGYHLVLLALMLWPMSLVIADAVVGAFKERKPSELVGGRFSRVMARVRGLDPRARFLLAWVVPSWIVFETVSTKLPHYVLPLYPALAVLGVRYVVRTTGWVGLLGVLIWFVLGIGVVALPIAGMRWLDFAGSDGERVLVYAMGGVALVALGVSVVHVMRARVLVGVMSAVISMGITSSMIFAVVLPGVRTPWVTARVMQEIERVDPEGQRTLAAVGYQEDSLVFSTGGRIQRVGGKRAAAWLGAFGDGLMVIDKRKIESVGGEDAVRVLAEVSGFNYSNGEWVDVLIIERGGEHGE